MEVLEENATNWLILTPEGGTDTKTKSSDLNQLLYGQNLWGLLDAGDEIWTSSGNDKEPTVTIIPDENAECYTLQIGDYPDLTLGKHHKTDLVEAMGTMFREYDGSVTPIITLYDDIRENMVRERVLDPFLDVFSDKVGKRDDGWFINGHLLLTYESEFYHPDNKSRTRSGRIIGMGMSANAYSINIDPIKDGMQRGITIDGEKYRLTESEVVFLAKAMWAIENVPDMRDN